VTIEERWQQGLPHDIRSEKIFHAIKRLDWENGDYFEFKYGGDGDNGEHLMYLLDIYFEEKDNE